jgi:filamentous hemagglutinin
MIPILPRDNKGIINTASADYYQRNPVGAYVKDISYLGLSLLGINSLDDYITDRLNHKNNKLDRVLIETVDLGITLSRGGKLPKKSGLGIEPNVYLDVRREIPRPLDDLGRIQSRINVTNDGFEHVKEGHLNGSKKKSQFTITEKELRALLTSKEVVNTPVTRILKSGNEWVYIRDVVLDKPIGEDKFDGYKPTNKMSVMTDFQGNLITTSPGTIK